MNTQDGAGTVGTANDAKKSVDLSDGPREIRKPTTKGITSIVNYLRAVDLRIPHQVFDVKIYQEALGSDAGFKMFEARKNEFHTLIVEAVLKTPGILPLWVADVAKMSIVESEDLPFEDALAVVVESVRLIDVERLFGYLTDFFTEIGGRLVAWNEKRLAAERAGTAPTA